MGLGSAAVAKLKVLAEFLSAGVALAPSGNK